MLKNRCLLGGHPQPQNFPPKIRCPLTSHLNPKCLLLRRTTFSQLHIRARARRLSSLCPWSLCPYVPALRIYPMQRPSKRNCLAHMIQPAHPRHHAFNSHAEPRMRHAAIPPQIEVPLKRFARQPMRVDPRTKQLVARHALRPANDLAVSLRRTKHHPRTARTSGPADRAPYKTPSHSPDSDAPSPADQTAS